MRIRRGKLLAGASCAAAGATYLSWPADAAEYSWRWALDVPAAHEIGELAIDAAAKIGSESGGRIEIKVFPQSVLGGQSEVVGQVRLGAIELCSAGDFVLESIAPATAFSTIPFAFPTVKDAWTAMDGPLGKMITASIAKAGIYSFSAAWDAGYRDTYNRLRPIRTAADVRGMKIRIPPTKLWSTLFQGLGMSPTPITAAEQYPALQTGLIDACESGISGYQSYKLWEVTKYCSLTKHAWTGYRMLMNPDTHAKLPPNLRDIVDKTIDTNGMRSRQRMAQIEGATINQVRSEGVAVNDCDLPSFKAAVRAAGLYGQWRTQYGAEGWALLEKSTGPLA